jgi:hypothetical protein
MRRSMRWYDENDEVDAKCAAELEARELRLLTATEPTDRELAELEAEGPIEPVFELEL